MAIYTYAVIDSNTSNVEVISGIDPSSKGKGRSILVGLEGACVYNLPYRDMGIAVSSHGGQIQNITQEHVLNHERVVEKLMESFTVLPMKFSTQFSREKDALLMMQEYYGDFRENLDRLYNKVEFGVKIVWPGKTIKNRIMGISKKYQADIVAPGDSPKKSFVKEKFEKYKIDKEFSKEADRCIALLDDFFSRFAVEKKLEKLKSDNLLLSAYYLVEKEKQKDFKEAFERAKNTQGDLKYLFSGPWPPYNFIILTHRMYLTR